MRVDHRADIYRPRWRVDGPERDGVRALERGGL